MALLEYVESVDPANMIVAVGVVGFLALLGWIVYRVYGKMIVFLDIRANIDSKYSIIEETALDKIGSLRGLDLNKELAKRDFLMKEKKSIRRKIEAEVYESLFPEKKGNKE